MSRQSVIDLIVARGVATPQQLQSKTVQELERILDESLIAGIRAEAAQAPAIVERQRKIDEINEQRRRDREEHQLNLIFRTPVNGKIAIDNIANRGVIRSWVDETKDEAITPAWFIQVLKETPSLARTLSWQSADILDPVKRRQAEAAQDAEERRVFHDFCRDNGFSEVEANFSLAKSVLGSFDQNTLAQAVQSGLQLAPASPEELEPFRQETIERHNFRLQSMDILSLRKLARENGARGITAPPSDETQRIRQEQRADGFKFLPLPDEIRDANGNEVVLNADYVRRCSKETMRVLVKRYGFDQINDLLQNRVAGSVWEV
jgi:hypothetical protein